jgi:hypothetical protein
MGKRGRRVKRAPEELQERLREQYGFLTRSAAAYDAGIQSEAQRLAVALRVLLHDEGKSRSVLGQLGVLDRLRFEDTALYPSPTLVSKAGLVMVQWRAGQDATHVPPLGDLVPLRVHPPLPFRRWWSVKVIEGSGGRTYSRRALVLTMANQDGGAHVDPELDADYEVLRHDSLGITHTPTSVELTFALHPGPDGRRPDAPARIMTGQPAGGNVAAASVRQVAFEVATTLERDRSLIL